MNMIFLIDPRFRGDDVYCYHVHIVIPPVPREAEGSEAE